MNTNAEKRKVAKVQFERMWNGTYEPTTLVKREGGTCVVYEVEKPVKRTLTKTTIGRRISAGKYWIKRKSQRVWKGLSSN